MSKLVLVGDGGVGKTTWVHRLLTHRFMQRYVATLGVQLLPVSLSCESPTFEVWDCAGQEKFGGLRTGYYVGATCAIVMFDVAWAFTFQSVERWIRDISTVHGGIPIVVVGNKVDTEETPNSFKVPQDNRELLTQLRNATDANILDIVFISVKTFHNCGLPLQTLSAYFASHN